MTNDEISGQEPDGSNDHRRSIEAIAKRVHRALDSFYHVKAANEDGKYTVFSGSGETYTVDVSDGSCTCPDGQRGSWCKHAYRVAFVTGQFPNIDDVRVESDAPETTDATEDNDASAIETLVERVERFEANNPDASAIEAISQLGIDPGNIDRVEEVLAS